MKKLVALVALVLVFAYATSASAVVIAESSGQTNPTAGTGTDPWLEHDNNTAVGATSSGFDTEDYWRIDTSADGGRWRYEVDPLTSLQYDDPSGWTFTARVKVNSVTALWSSNMVLLDDGNGYYYTFMSDGVYTGDPPAEKGDYDTSEYHTYQMVMDPAGGGGNGLLTYYVDGDPIDTQVRSYPLGGGNKDANFGDGNGSAGSDIQFSLLKLETGQHVVPEPGTMLLLGLGGLLLRKRR